MSSDFSPTPDIPEDKIRFREVVLGGASWSHVVKRGSTLRLIDPQGGANVSALFFNYELLVERYNMSDTLKAQHVAYLTTGRALYSDMGRILVSLTQDTSGWHDTICGHSTAAIIEKKYGPATFQEHRNRYHRNGRDSFLVELGKYGLGAKDLVPNANFFSKVTVDEAGALHFDETHARQGAFVDLRAELNTLVVLNTCPHPLAPAGNYAPKPVHLVVYSSDPAGPDDVVRTFRPENARGLEITDRYFM
jgi:hypothetical protein